MLLSTYQQAFQILLDLWVRSVPFSVPLILGIILLLLWKWYVKFDYLSKMDWVLLEIRLPQNIEKSPLAMETVIGALSQTYEGNWWNRLLRGILRVWFSLELVSLNGNVHFFIRTIRLFKNLVQSQIYAQYPGVEINEAEDYTMMVNYDDDKTLKLWASELKLEKPDPYPIKTYVDYKLDQGGAEETEKIDPLTPTIEYLGSLSPGEQAWIQILVMATKNRRHKHGTLFGKSGWKEEGKELAEKLMKRTGKGAVSPEGLLDFSKVTLSPGEREVVEAIERSVSKPGFDCGIRMIYLAPPDKYSLPNQLNLKNCFKQYNTLHLNGFKQLIDTTIDFPWQDPTGHRLRIRKRRLLKCYRARAQFYHPHARHPFVLNTEELATIFHFPGSVATTPLIGRIPSKKGEPPPNLPI